MLNILNNGYKKILRLFYTEKAKFHLREIAKRTKLNEKQYLLILKQVRKREDTQIRKTRELKNIFIKEK